MIRFVGPQIGAIAVMAAPAAGMSAPRGQRLDAGQSDCGCRATMANRVRERQFRGGGIFAYVMPTNEVTVSRWQCAVGDHFGIDAAFVVAE